MSESTLVLVKPDGVKDGHIGDVISRFERRGFEITALRVMDASKEQLAAHYHDLVDKPFYHEIEDYMQEGPIVAMIVTGTHAVETIHTMAGATQPSEAAGGTIRGDYARDYDDGSIRNIVHSSDDVNNAKTEIKIWFPED